MLKYFAAALILAAGFCTGAINHQTQESRQKSIGEAERYAAYSAVLTAMFVHDSTKLLVIEDKTADDFTAKDEKHWDYIKKGLEPLSQITIDDFTAKNAQPTTIESKFTLTTKVTLVSKSEVDKLFGQGGGWWKAFYEKYPGSSGLITFSNVGFNGDGTQALLYVGYSCGGLCGSGHYVLLAKNNGAWKIEKSVMTWIS